MHVLLLYPKNPEIFWSFEHVVRFVSKRCAFPPLGLLTVAAMLPREWGLEFVDLNVDRLHDAQIERADYVMISAMIVHRDSVHALLARCRARQKPVIAGGPLFTTGHGEFPRVGQLVLGEAEDLMPQLVADMQHGVAKACYQASERPDVALTPPPRWDLIDPDHYVTMSAQFWARLSLRG